MIILVCLLLIKIFHSHCSLELQFHDLFKLVVIDATTSIRVNIAHELLPDYIRHGTFVCALSTESSLEIFLFNIVSLTNIQSSESFLQVAFADDTAGAEEFRLRDHTVLVLIHVVEYFFHILRSYFGDIFRQLSHALLKLF